MTESELPLVSVVIPAWNSERYLGRAIRSALVQTWPRLECLVVDDGSTDGTPSVIASFGDRIRSIRQENGGASAARNAGIAAARGQYIAFLDSDDYWLRTKLANQLAVFRTDPELVLVSTGFRWIGANVDPDAFDDAGPEFDLHSVRRFEGIERLLEQPYLGTPTVMVKTSTAQEVGGFDVKLPSAEDIDFYFRVCAQGPYALLDQELVRFQLRPGSLTADLSVYQYNLEVLDRLSRSTPGIGEGSQALIRAKRLEIYAEWARALIYRGHGRLARAVLEEGRRFGRLPGRQRLRLKSFFAPTIRAARGLRRRVAS